MTAIGNAPCSYGAFEVTVGHDPNVPDAVQVLDAVQAAGYEGIDLGPLGYLGLGNELKDALHSRGLLLTGGYLEIDISSLEASRRGFAELTEICDQFDAVSEGVDKTLLPRPTVALVAPTSTATGDEPESTRLTRIARIIDELVDQCRGRGYEACLHNELGTLIGTQESIVWALESTPVALCLDTGNLVAASGDPLVILEKWWDRVNHVHLKDAHAPSEGHPYNDAMSLWEGDGLCPLGAGDGRIDAVLGTLRVGGYDGWIVVEQDVLPSGAESYERARVAQVENRQYLRDRGW